MIRTPRLGSTLAFALALTFAASALPAAARDFVQDQAGMFSAATVSGLNARIGSFNAQTGKEIVVLTAPSLNGQTLQAAAGAAFSQQNVNGVLIYIAKNDRKDLIVPDRAGVQAGWFPQATISAIEKSMSAQFKDGDFDGGIASAVNSILSIYRAHLSSRGAAAPGTAPAPATSSNSWSFGGFHLSMFWWIIIAVVGFLLLRSLFRAMSGPRYYGSGPVPPGGMMPGYGPGYGGYGYGGGGGSFWSGLLGGLGGAWLGNELFNQHGGMSSPADAAQTGGADPNAAGWQNDAGQADLSNSAGGDWGGGGFGDSGGGFSGGDFGGGGGDAGGSW